MVFVQIMSMKPTVTNQQRAEWLKKRASWKTPPGVKVIAEYAIPTGANKLILVYEAPDVSSIASMRAPWLDWFEIDVFPAMSGEELTRMGAQIIQALGVKG